jgi:hypothetical protein
MIEIQGDESPGKIDRIGADRQGIDDGQHSPHLPTPWKSSTGSSLDQRIRRDQGTR